MSELKEFQALIVGPKLKPQERLSPTSINTYFKCPRQYFYTYIAKLQVEPNIHLVKGGIVHKALEDFFRGYSKDLKDRLMKYFENAWKKEEKRIRLLELTEEQETTAYLDCKGMLLEYFESFIRKVNQLIIAQKAENESHAFYLLKPTFREKWVESKDLHLCGFIDRVSQGYDGLLTLGDYKTSKKYGIGLPEDYKRQLALYALLWNYTEKTMPDFVAVDFLRYGETYFLEVTPGLIKYAREALDYVWERTRSVDIKDYPLKESNLCKWCNFLDICSGQSTWNKKHREAKMKELVENKLNKPEQKSEQTKLEKEEGGE